MGGGVGRGVADFARSFPFLVFRGTSDIHGRVGAFLLDEDAIGCRGARGGKATGWEREPEGRGATALTAG